MNDEKDIYRYLDTDFKKNQSLNGQSRFMASVWSLLFNELLDNS